MSRFTPRVKTETVPKRVVKANKDKKIKFPKMKYQI